MKKINTKDAVRKLAAGVQEVSDVVKTTLGGRGKNVILRDPNGMVQVINDGVTIASQIFLEDPEKDAGASLAKQVAYKTNEQSGDGTTTSIILLAEYLKVFLKNIDSMKKSEARDLRTNIEEEVDSICKMLDSRKTKVTKKDLINIAKVSSLDDEIADVISKVIKKIGKDGAIVVDDAQRAGVSFEIQEGISIDDGFSTPYLITESEGQKAILTDVPVLLSRKKIDDLTEITTLLENLKMQGMKKIAIFAREFSDDVLTFFVINKAQGNLNPILITTEDLKEIATVTGATIITEENGVMMDVEALGGAGKVIVAKDYSTVLDGKEDKAKVKGKIENLKKRLKEAEAPATKYELQERIAKLTEGVAVIKIAGNNQVESGEKKLKMEDAINAVRSAMSDGVVEGGGMALLRIAQKLYDGRDDIVAKMMHDILTSPARQILDNADEPQAKYDALFIDSKGYNVVTREWEDFKETGVLDPVKVTKSALRNAVSMGNTIMTAEASVIYTPDENNNNKTR